MSEIIINTQFGNRYKFEVVNEVPEGYKIWVAFKGSMINGYTPLYKPTREGHVSVRTLKAIRTTQM